MSLSNHPRFSLARAARCQVAVASAVLLTLPLTVTTAGAAPSDTGATNVAAARGLTPSAQKPRTIVTTDPELDDLNSLLRFLLYSNEIEVAGIVLASSQHHWAGDEALGVAPKRWPAPGDRLHIEEALDRYEEVYANLSQHAEGYPSPESLRSITANGNYTQFQEYAVDTDGSDLIKSVLLDDDDRQVFLQVWGGPATVARALKSIEEEYSATPGWDELRARVSAKAVITAWGHQDQSFNLYIRPAWPDIEFRQVSTSIWGYGARGSVLPEWAHYLSPEWTKANVSDVGPIGESYRVWGDGKQMAPGDVEDYFGLTGYTAAELRAMGYAVWTPPQPQGAWISEGDSSNFALLVDNGLRSWEDPSYGGWGGRQVESATIANNWSNSGVRDLGPDGTPRNDYAAARWFEDFQLDFAARLQWSVTPSYGDANHEPIASVPAGKLNLVAQPGERVQLVGSAADPDGDATEATWWQYREAGTYPSAVTVAKAGSAKSPTWSVVVPEDAEPGQTIHLILEVEDDGVPSLTSYQRVVITVG